MSSTELRMVLMADEDRESIRQGAVKLRDLAMGGVVPPDETLRTLGSELDAITAMFDRSPVFTTLEEESEEYRRARAAEEARR